MSNESENKLPLVVTDQSYGHQIEVVFEQVEPFTAVTEISGEVYSAIVDALADNSLSGTFDVHDTTDDGLKHQFTGKWRVITPKPECESDLEISDDEGDTISVSLSPNSTPNAYERRVQCLMKSGLPEDMARTEALITSITLELFYSIDRGLFAVESDAVESIPIYNPYTGAEIPDKR